MTRIVLEISQDKDVALLLALLKRLDIRVVQATPDKSATPLPSNQDQAIILGGLPVREDIEEFIRDFQKSREDRLLPGRQN